MSFKSNITNIESALVLLKQQASTTSENWDDIVQERYYKQFINSLPKEVLTYLTELSKIDKSLEKAEQTINNLHE